MLQKHNQYINIEGSININEETKLPVTTENNSDTESTVNNQFMKNSKITISQKRLMDDSVKK